MLVTERFLPLAESIIRVRGVDLASMVLLPNPEETEYGYPLHPIDRPRSPGRRRQAVAGVTWSPSLHTVADDVEAAYEYAYANGWTDGLPIIPPTPTRVT